ncbi:MAG: VCBS repeat-containing protein [Roseibacillus sp.]|jgi:hypothetical protein|nr:VCBS repeat-containing protein [Roseibacillus sp.]|tara:strand:- start:1096 stop:1389 length:294 start_codon:yes stop_codon:yes gene_type:complete
MKTIVTFGIAWGLGAAGAVEFEKPVRLSGGGEVIKVERPGYAAPCLADLNGDGKKDLLVGQFNKGKIRVFLAEGDGKFAKGEWLKTGDKVAEIPGVW